MQRHPPARGAWLALDTIAVRENVRDLDAAHVANLAQSIPLRGVLVPLIVRLIDDGYELVAGYHRIAACRSLGLPDVLVAVREREGSSADSAAENVTLMSAVLDRPDPLTLVQSARPQQHVSNDRRLARTVRSAITRPVAPSTAPTVCDALCVSAPITIISTIPSLGLTNGCPVDTSQSGRCHAPIKSRRDPRTAAGDTTTGSQTAAHNRG
ncbi:MAG: ParB/RepB/Spo0J family partition protein [Solirubrobacteraceae bacterium]